MKKPADCKVGRLFACFLEKIDTAKTNVFGRKTGETVGNCYKNPIITAKNRENAITFVNLTKIGIEIYKPFVYNVFIAVLENQHRALEGGAFPKGD